MKNLILLFLLPLTCFAAPPSFRYEGSQAVFVDFTQVTYEMSFQEVGMSWVSSTITFVQKEDGHPLLTLEKTAEAVRIDGVETEILRATPPGQSKDFAVIAKKLKAGEHKLTLRTKLHFGLGGKLDIYFKMRDIYGWFLERFLPTNMEFDQYPVTMLVKLKVPKPSDYALMVNAHEKSWNESTRTWTLKFPESTSTSGLFFHLVPKKDYQFLDSTFTTLSGRTVAIQLYGKAMDLVTFEAETQRVFRELEADYGEYSHPFFIVYAEGKSGGMEYAGATETSLVSLDHELFHSYFGRGVMPANGNAGAIDEGLASWRDYGYQRLAETGFKNGGLAGQSPYARNTHKKSYKLGRKFFGHLDYLLADQGGLKPFLRYFHGQYAGKTFTVDLFLFELNLFTAKDFSLEFEKYLY